MTATLVPDFSISIQQRRWACVLDPILALSEYGLPLVKQLGVLTELWVVREFWHILDNTQFYLRQPELFLGQIEQPRSPQTQRLSQQVIRSLHEWERLRTMTDRNAWNINFLADVIGESCIPQGVDSDIIWRWESLAQSLDAGLETHLTKTDTLSLAFRDLISLAAARPACILTLRSVEATAQNLPPDICTTLEQWGIQCQEVSSANAIANIERDQFRNLLVHAGLSKFLWSGLNLAVLHLVVPAAATLSATDWADDRSFADLDLFPAPPTNLWENTKGFWYSVT
jgi:hypothetical protein